MAEQQKAAGAKDLWVKDGLRREEVWVDDGSNLTTPLERVFSWLQTKALAKRLKVCGVGEVCTVWQPEVRNTTADGDTPSPLAGWGKTPWPGGKGAGRKRDRKTPAPAGYPITILPRLDIYE